MRAAASRRWTGWWKSLSVEELADLVWSDVIRIATQLPRQLQHVNRHWHSEQQAARLTFVHNFDNSCPIFKILSLLDSALWWLRNFPLHRDRERVAALPCKTWVFKLCQFPLSMNDDDFKLWWTDLIYLLISRCKSMARTIVTCFRLRRYCLSCVGSLSGDYEFTSSSHGERNSFHRAWCETYYTSIPSPRDRQPSGIRHIRVNRVRIMIPTEQMWLTKIWGGVQQWVYLGTWGSKYFLMACLDFTFIGFYLTNWRIVVSAAYYSFTKCIECCLSELSQLFQADRTDQSAIVVWFWGRGSQPLPTSYGVWGNNTVSSLSRVRDGAPTANAFWSIQSAENVSVGRRYREGRGILSPELTWTQVSRWRSGQGVGLLT